MFFVFGFYILILFVFIKTRYRDKYWMYFIIRVFKSGMFIRGVKKIFFCFKSFGFLG